MKTVAAKLYEGMFLVDSALAASDWQDVNDAISSILDRVGAEMVSIKKWDDRRLAYDIMGKSRGAYILAYFRVDGTKIAEIERAVQLSEKIMRLLVLCVEDLDEEYLSKDTPESETQEPESESAAEKDVEAGSPDKTPDANDKTDESPEESKEETS